MPSYRFGPYRLDTGERVLTRAGRPVALTNRMYGTLAALVGRAGRVVEKDELMREVWADAIVEEGNLTQVVFRLRKALGGGAAKYIETVPRRGYRFAAAVREERDGGGEAAAAAARADGEADVYPVAVLPLSNAGQNPVPEEIADGITEALISTLSRRPRLRVMAASTVFRYKALKIDPLEVGRQLGVRAVLVGRVTYARDQLMVAAELVEVASGALLWGGRCARPSESAVEAQDEITDELAGCVGTALGAAGGGPQASAESREARRLYLSGRHLWNKRQPDDLKKALSFFRRALDADPSYAPAYAGLADCYDTLTGVGAFAPDEGYPKAKAAALRALEFDEELAEAHASLGHVHMRYDWDWEAAEREYLRAVELNPSYAPARHWLSIYLTITGRHVEAIAEGERARQLDPLSPMISLFQGAHLYFARRFEESLARCQRVLEAEPDFVIAHCFTAQALSRCGRHDEAISAGLAAHRLTNGSAATLSMLCNFYAVASRQDEARAALSELAGRAAVEYVNPFELATAHVALGDERAALDCLERAYGDRVGDIIFLGVSPEFDPLRTNLRFRRLLARLKLPKPLTVGRRLSAVS